AIAVVDPGHAVGREQQLTQVLAAPPRGPERMTAQPVQVDQDDPRDRPPACDAFDIQEEVAEVQVLMKEAGPVQGGCDPGQLGDQPPLHRGEVAPVETFGQPGQGLVQRLAAGQFGDHQEALELGAWSDLLAGCDDLGDLDAQRPGALEVSPFGAGGRV